MVLEIMQEVLNGSLTNMATLNQQIKKANSVTPEAIESALFVFIKSIEKNFITSNKEQIFDFSSDIFGKSIGFYSKGTEAITGGFKKAGDPFTGVDTGSWFKGFFAEVKGNALFFGSKDVEKNKAILGSKSTWLSKDLFGLTDDNLKLEIDRSIKPFFVKYFSKELA